MLLACNTAPVGLYFSKQLDQHQAFCGCEGREHTQGSLFEIVDRFDTTDVLIDDRPVPYARELWLPLVWLLIR